MQCDDSFIMRKIKLSIEKKMTGSASDLKEQLEHILENSQTSHQIKSVPIHSSAPRIQRSKICGMDQSFVFMCIIILLIIFFKYHDIMNIFSYEKKSKRNYVQNLMQETYDYESDNESDDLEKKEKEKYHIPEKDDLTSIKKLVNRNEINNDQMSYSKKKNKDPLFQEFI